MTLQPAHISLPAAPSASRPEALALLLDRYSIEATARDVDAVVDRAPANCEVFVANLPRDGNDVLVAAATRLRKAGLTPVPHIVARKLHDRAELDDLVARLAGEAGVDRLLALGGDSDAPAGAFKESLALIETGVFERHGIRHVSVACYPESHPRISEPALQIALRYKIAALVKRGIEACLVSQFAFDAEPIVTFARELRATGVSTPLRVGVAGPASRTALIRYAVRCGVGASLRTLTQRRTVGGLFSGENPARLLEAIAAAARDDTSLRIEGVHFFTFGAPAPSIEWVEGSTA
jgi:methylenetetrahydrofolate reductase (NADPH)